MSNSYENLEIVDSYRELSNEDHYHRIVEIGTHLGRQAVELFTNEGVYLNDEHLDIFERVASGQTRDYITQEIGMPESTIRHHLNVTNKGLGAKNLADAIRIAHYRDLLPAKDQPIPAKPLTVKQKQVLTMFSQGLEYTEIARKLSLSLQSINKHMKSVITNLGANDRFHAIRIGLETDAIHPPFDREIALREVGRLSAKASSILLNSLPPEYRNEALRGMKLVGRDASDKIADVLIDNLGRGLTYEEIGRLVYPDELDNKSLLSRRVQDLFYQPRMHRLLDQKGFKVESQVFPVKQTTRSGIERHDLKVMLIGRRKAETRPNNEGTVDRPNNARPTRANWEHSFTEQILRIINTLTIRAAGEEDLQYHIDDLDARIFLLEQEIIDSRKFFSGSKVELYAAVSAMVFKLENGGNWLLNPDTRDKATKIINQKSANRLAYVRSKTRARKDYISELKPSFDRAKH